MRYGCCIGFGGYIPPEFRDQGKTSAESYQEKVNWLIRHIAFLHSIGYDYVELPASTVANSSPGEFDYLRQEIHAAPLHAEVFNCFVPGSIKLVGNEVDIDAIKTYLELVIPRMASCGAKTIVLGSGAARNVPDGFPDYKAEAQIMDFLRLASDMTMPRKMMIAIEPLNSKECNFINLIGDALGILEELDRPNVKIAADFYHMTEENEGPDVIALIGGTYIAHVHLADTGRLNPGSGSYDYQTFFEALKEIEYDGTASLECQYKDYENDVKASLAFLKKAWAEAKVG